MMVKVKLTFLFLSIAFAVAAQQKTTGDSIQTGRVDSVKIKLDQLRKEYESGAMGEEDYNKKKAEITGVPSQNEIEVTGGKPNNPPGLEVLRKADTMSMTALKDRYHSRVIAGSVITTVGLGFVVGDILFAALAQKINPHDTTYADEVSLRRNSQIALGVIGGLVSSAGTVFLTLGLKDKAIYKRRGKELTMVLKGNEIGFAFIF
jgi:hypothetical protein